MASRGLRWALLVAAALIVVGPSAARAELRINALDVFLNDHQITAKASATGVLPEVFREAVERGAPLVVRFTFELWRYQRMWADRKLASVVVERELTYNAVSKEYRIAAPAKDPRSAPTTAYTTKDPQEARRALSEARVSRLSPAGLEPADVFYVRALIESGLDGETGAVARLAGAAMQATQQSGYLTLQRTQ